MRVLIVSRCLNMEGGVVNFIAVLLDKFTKGIDVENFYIGKRLSDRINLIRIFRLIVDLIRFSRKINRFKYDVIHLNPSLDWKSFVRDSLFMCVIRILNKESNVLVFFHGWDENLFHTIKKSKILRIVMRSTFGSAQSIVVLGKIFKLQLEQLDISSDKVKVLSTMFDGKEFNKVLNRSNLKTKNILFMARLIKKKGVYELLSAFKKLLPDYKLRLYILGNGREYQGIANWIQDQKLIDKIALIGYVEGPEKIHYLINSDIFVLPTRHGEGCPVSLLEAMAAGLPVITTRVGGIPDILEEGVNGLYISLTNGDSLYTNMKYLLTNTNEAKKMGERNYVKAWNEYESEKVSLKIEALYHDVIVAKS